MTDQQYSAICDKAQKLLDKVGNESRQWARSYDDLKRKIATGYAGHWNKSRLLEGTDSGICSVKMESESGQDAIIATVEVSSGGLEVVHSVVCNRTERDSTETPKKKSQSVEDFLDAPITSHHDWYYEQFWECFQTCSGRL
jgi:hypothetical protein